MTEFDFRLVREIEHNSMLFLEMGIRLLTKKESLSLRDKIVLACADIQISLELALRAHVIRNYGFNFIVDSKQRGKYTEEELMRLYEQNQIKVTEFESLKNLLRSSRNSFFDSDDFAIIDRFQLYRNKIVHFCCSISPTEEKELQDDLLYYVVQIVLRLLFENYNGQTPGEYFQELLGYNGFNLLLKSEGYNKAITKLASKRRERIGICPLCCKETYNMDDEFCYFCNVQSNDDWGRADCLACGGKGSVIYDRLNIHLPGNHHSMPGFCQLCESRPEIFECPKCGQNHWMYVDKEDWMCDEGHCSNDGC